MNDLDTGKKPFAGVMIFFFSFLVCTTLSFQGTALAREVSPEARVFLNKMSNYLAEIAEVTKPSVVNISTTTTVSMKEHPMGEFFNDPFFKRFFGNGSDHPGMPRKFKSSALGSGVIVSQDGYILTNYHVIKNAEEIKVILYDKREFKGKVIGDDPQTDIAVIKVDAKELPAIRMGDSSKLKAGDMVLAIGNPFGLNQTVTLGIVSAVGRANIGISAYEDYIQTDAAINPGNSGGALVNANGELVGINSAIYSTSGGYMGVGFAIPSDMANSVSQSILKYGKVIRGWFGVTIQDLTPELVKSFGLKEEKGALVTDVIRNGPAGKAGLKRGDLITAFDGKPVDDSTSLRNMVANTAPGKAVPTNVIRQGKEETLSVTLGEFPSKMTAKKLEHDNVLKGVGVRELTPDLRTGLNIPAEVEGVLVTDVSEESPSYGLIAKNDVIEEVDRKPITNLKAYEGLVSKIGHADTILLLVYRNGGYLYVTIKQSEGQ
ncbi:MAG: DegQ family serine endoprotease [Nitrospiraceae bacterium]|nr:DegQ family serine endoprotease [Nitrospiraceae bacterium]